MSVTKEQPRPSLTAGFIIGGSDEILNTLTHRLMSSFTFCTQIQTHAPEPSDVSGCLHRSPRKKGFFFLVTSCSVSLQHVAMATENLLKGLTALLVFRRKGFVWRHLQHPCVCAFVKRACVRCVTCTDVFWVLFSSAGFSACEKAEADSNDRKNVSNNESAPSKKNKNKNFTGCCRLHGCKSSKYFKWTNSSQNCTRVFVTQAPPELVADNQKCLKCSEALAIRAMTVITAAHSRTYVRTEIDILTLCTWSCPLTVTIAICRL